jgi:hypothetical protein
MADDPNVRGGRDLYRVILSQPHEVAYWTKALGINEELLRKVVAAVGDRVDAVRQHLGK